MNLESIKNNKAGMIFQFSIPAIIAMVLTSLITVTDGFFTGNYIGKEAIAAINLGLPIVYLFLGLGLMLAVGGSVIAGMLLGGKDVKKANEVFNQTTVVMVCISVITSIIIYILFQPVMTFLHVGANTASYFTDYYLILLLELPLMIINNGFGMFIRGEGNPQFFMKVSIVNVVGNIILDYLCVGVFSMGIRGIAVSSLFCAVVSSLMILFFFWKKSKIYHFGKFTFDSEILKQMILNGSSEFIGEMSMCITMYAYNYVIQKNIGIDGITAFTVVGYVSYVFSMVLTGFGQGFSPLISFTHGAKDYETERSLRKLTNLYVFIAGVIVILVMLVTSGWYSSLFVKNTAVQNMIAFGIKIFILSFLFDGINTISSFYFTSVGKAKESAVISSLRGLLLLLVCIFTLPHFFGITGVWLVAPVTEALTILASFFYLHQNDQKIYA